MRLGEILIGSGAVSDAQVAEALARQRTSRQRLGAALVSLGYAGADVVACALARQHGVPAALERHLQQRDPALVTLIPSALAIGISAVPVAWSRAADGVSLVVCFRDPGPEYVAEVVRATGHRVIPAVACESTVAREIARAYAAPGVPGLADRGPARAPGGVPDQSAAVDVDFDEPSQPRMLLDLVGLDDDSVQRDASQIADRVPTRTEVAPPAGHITLEAAIAGMAQADGSDRIADLAIGYARGAWRGGVVLIVREGLAVGHRGFGGKLSDAAVASLVVPLGQPSVLATVYETQREFAGDAPAAGLAQARFLSLFAELGPRPMAVVPVAVRGRVVSLIVTIAPTGPLADSVAVLVRLATAMGAAYERLIEQARAAKASAPTA